MTDTSSAPPAGGALTGIRVIDLAGPAAVFCTRLLAEMGADVIKVEPPSGDPLRSNGPYAEHKVHPDRSLPFWMNNMNKRGVTLDIHTRTGQELLRQLIASAQVVIESAKPGELDELGIGYETCAKGRKDLVWSAVTPFGQTGPYRDYRGSDTTGQAIGGAIYLTGEPKKRPMRANGRVADYMAGYTAGAATMFALYRREKTGEGQYIDVSQQEAVCWQMESSNLNYVYEGSIYSRDGRLYPRATYPAGLYPCLDGWVSWVAAQPHQWTGVVEMVDDERLRDPKWMDGSLRYKERRYLDDIIVPWTRTQSKFDIFQEGQRRRIPTAVSYTPLETVRDVHLRNRGYFTTMDHPELGIVEVPAPGFSMTGSPPAHRLAAPALGEHNVEVFGELGLDEDDVAGLRRQGVL